MYKDVYSTIKKAIDYPPKLDLDKVNYVNFFELAQITKKTDNFGQVVLLILIDINLK